MRIGVVGDTHDRLPNVERIVDLFRAAEVDRVVHTGDITRALVLERFARLDRPLFGVFGNNDAGEETRLEATAAHFGQTLLPPPQVIEWAARRILVVHDPETLPNDAHEDVDLILHGHTHRYRLERHGRALAFNPGECAGLVAGANAVGVVDLTTLEAERLRF